MEETEDSLNYDFNFNMVLGKSLLSNLGTPQERQLATNWLRKLSAPCGSSLDELRLRNMFTFHLVLALRDGQLRPPFDAEPPAAPLSNLHHLLPEEAFEVDDELGPSGQDGDEGDGGQEGGSWPPLYEHSPDGGAFLAAQPVPRCGAFCYLAVVARQDQ